MRFDLSFNKSFRIICLRPTNLQPSHYHVRIYCSSNISNLSIIALSLYPRSLYELLDLFALPSHHLGIPAAHLTSTLPEMAFFLFLPIPLSLVHKHNGSHITCTLAQTNLLPNLSRRAFLSLTTLVVAEFCLPPASKPQSPPSKTILDEQIELFELQKEQAQQRKLASLNNSFDAAQKTAQQLQNVPDLLDQHQWYEIRMFTRFFNNALVRERIHIIIPQLSNKSDRQKLSNLSNQLTQSLKQLDQAALQQDSKQVLHLLSVLTQMLEQLQNYRPSTNTIP